MLEKVKINKKNLYIIIESKFKFKLAKLIKLREI